MSAYNAPKSKLLILIHAFPTLFFYHFDPLKNRTVADSIENKLEMFALLKLCPGAKLSVHVNVDKNIDRWFEM